MVRFVQSWMTNEYPHDTGEGALSTTELHAVLTSEDRRRVLRFFLERDERVATMDELANHLAATDGGSEGPERAKVDLHHVLLPKLAEVGFLDYDHRSNTVQYRGHVLLEDVLSCASVT